MHEFLSNNRRWVFFFICVIFTSVAFFAYHPLLKYDFINFDDHKYVYENMIVKKGLTLEGIRWAFTTFDVSNWHPVAWISHMTDVQLYGLDAGKHHATSLIIHIINAVLLLSVFLMATQRLWPSIMVAGLFLVHPMHVESVAWISERKDVLSLFFMLVTFMFYTSYVKSQKNVLYWAALLFFAIGLMAKPMLVSLPFLLLLFDYWPLYRLQGNERLHEYHGDFSLQSEIAKQSIALIIKKAGRLLIEKLPFFILSGISCFVTLIAQNKGGAVRSLTVLPFFARVANAIISYFEYIRKFFYPVDLALQYPYPESLLLYDIFMSGLFLIMVTLLAVFYIRKKPYFIVGWLWFVGSLIPVIGIVQVGAQAMADRYAYIPYIGLYVIFVFSLSDIFKKMAWVRSFVNAVFILVFCVFTSLTAFQVKFWNNSISVFEHTLAINKRNWVAHVNLGNGLRDNKRLEEAITHFYDAIAINPNYHYAYLGLGNCYFDLKKYNEAMNNFLTVIKIDPGHTIAYYNIGHIYLLNRQYAQAAAYFMKAIRLDPDFAEAYHYMGVIYAEQGLKKEAMTYLDKASQLGSAGAKDYMNRI